MRPHAGPAAAQLRQVPLHSVLRLGGRRPTVTQWVQICLPERFWLAGQGQNRWQARPIWDGRHTGASCRPLLPASLRTKPAACEARGVKRKAPASPIDMCEHVAQGSEERSLSAEIRAVGKQDPYRPPFSPLRLDTTSARVPAAGHSASGYIIRPGLLDSQKASSGVCSKK